MKRLTIIILSIISLTLISYNKTFAQISEGGTPPSFNFSTFKFKKLNSQLSIPIDVDIDQLKKEDVINESKGIPLRVAKIISTNLSIDNSGEWIKLPNGQSIWQLTVTSPEAIATILYYDEFYIPKGGRLFIYNQNKNQVLGAFTHNTNPIGKEFATDFITGDVFTLEYAPGSEEESSEDKPRIKISGIGYGYNHIYVNNTRGFGNAVPCMVNINCEEGANWQDEKKGVARILTRIGIYAYFCSGTLVNNTKNDFTPYFLTASHCFYGNYGDYAGDANINQMLFRFHYEHPGCENLSSEPSYKSMVGAQMLVNIPLNGGSDGVLLKLNQNIPANYDVYYNGWDRANTPATSGVGIHHPGGDVKKISTYTSSLQNGTWITSSEIGATNAHWKLFFIETKNGHGITQGGSSGSPLFNQNSLVVGTLTGGSTTCATPLNNDYYGKFWYHWDKHNSQQMKKYLDPTNTNQTSLKGISSKRVVPIPQNLTANLNSDNNVEISWDAPVVTDGDEVLKYYVYMNDKWLAETTSATYTDVSAKNIGNTVCYKVTAIYTSNTESLPSNSECVFIKVAVTGITLDPTNMRLTKGETNVITAKIAPSNATNKIIKSWSSNNNNIAKVDDSGKVTAISYGTALITATTEDGNFTATCTITVYNAKEGEIKANEAFSPNGDGVNDYFVIERLDEYKSNELTVFDRNGTIHYYIQNYNNDWDGVANRGPFKGQKIPVGTYYYNLKVEDKFNVKSFFVIRY